MRRDAVMRSAAGSAGLPCNDCLVGGHLCPKCLCYTGSKSVDLMPQFLSQVPPTLDLPSYTLARIRKGQGRLLVLTAALHQAGYALRPAPRVLIARVGQRSAARRSGLSRNTVAALARGVGTIYSYVTLVDKFGVHPRIVRRPRFSACFSSENQTWTTPLDLIGQILRAARRKRFDLDPCSPRHDGPVPARIRWTKDEDGLKHFWAGLVFCNPPYGRLLSRWLAYCALQAAHGAVVIALVPARPDTKAWHWHIVGKAVVIMLRGRLRFGGGQGSAPFPSALVVWGNPHLAEKIARHVPGSWHIPIP